MLLGHSDDLLPVQTLTVGSPRRMCVVFHAHGNGLFAGPDVKEEKAERARSLQMVLQQAEEERARRVAHDAKGESAV